MPSNCDAFVLHAKPWRETSLMVDVLTREFGRLRVVARGAKSKRRESWAALLQPFIPLQISFSTRGDWHTLTHAESSTVAQILADEASLCGLYCNELLLRLLQEQDAHPELFDRYAIALNHLALHDAQTVLREFEWQLLLALGYGFDLRYDRDGDAISESGAYRLAEDGFYPVQHAVDQDFPGNEILKMSEQLWSACPLNAKRLMRHLLANHLGNAPLQTRELWRQRESLKRLVEENATPV